MENHCFDDEAGDGNNNGHEDGDREDAPSATPPCLDEPTEDQVLRVQPCAPPRRSARTGGLGSISHHH